MKTNSKKSAWVVLVPASLLVIALLVLPQIMGNNKGEEVVKVNTNEVVTVVATNEQEVQDLLINGYTSEATNWLKLTRERSQESNMDSHVGYIREYAKKANITLADIGTSEEEIASLLKTSYISEATKWLQLTRERANSGDMDSHVGYLREYVEKAGITVEDIGTTEEEIASLLKTSYISEARTWLKLTRKRASQQNVELEIGYLRQYANLAGITLEQLGTSETELQSKTSI